VSNKKAWERLWKMKTRQEIKALAREAMAEQHGNSILLLLVYMFAPQGAFMAIGLVFGTLMMIPGMDMVGVPLLLVMYIGMFSAYMVVFINLYGEYIKIYKREKSDIGMLFTGLSVNFLRKLGGMLYMMSLIFLWSLFFYIPGIVKGFQYFFAPYILADCPKVTATEAVSFSMRITEGRRWLLFVFMLSWFGWGLLNLFTFGILWIVYLGPYFYTSCAGMYVEMRDVAIAEGRITRGELGLPEEFPDAFTKDEPGGDYNNDWHNPSSDRDWNSPRRGSGWEDEDSRRN